MNAVPDTTGKPTAADDSKGSLQSSFASVIGAAAAAATTNGDTKLGRAQNVDPKKTSSPESAKKSTSSSSGDTPSVQAVAVASVPLNVVVPVVPQTVVQPEGQPSAKDNTASADAPVVSKSSLAGAVSTINGVGTLDGTKPSATASLPKIATVGVQYNDNEDSKVDAATAEKVAETVPSGNSVSVPPAVEVSTKVSAETVSATAATSPKVTHEAVSTSKPAPAAPVSAAPVAVANALPSNRATKADGTADVSLNNTAKSDSVTVDAATVETTVPDAVYAAIANSNPTKAGAPTANVDGGITLNPAVLQVQMPVPVAVHAPASAQAPSASRTASTTPSATDVAAASKNPVPSGVVKQASTSVAPTLPVDSTVATAAPKSSAEPVSTQHVQSSAVSVPAAPTKSEPTPATPATEADAVRTTQPVETSVATLTPQAQTVAVAVPQQFVVQGAEVVQPGSSTFKVTTGKVETSGTSNVATVAGKGRASASDWRLNRNTATSDDKASSTDSDDASIATRVVTPEAGAKEIAGNIKGVLETANLAQNAQSAQPAGQITPAPAVNAPVAATQGSGTTANATLPAPATATESTQAAHALNSAQLIQSVHGSEMRLGMNSAEFGNISINTSLNHQTLSAQISMDHSALGSALAMHLPAIEEKLGSAYGLQAKVELHDTGAHSAANDSSNSSESRGDRRSQGGSAGTPTNGLQSAISSLTSSNFTPSSTSMAAGTSRLDIRI